MILTPEQLEKLDPAARTAIASVVSGLLARIADLEQRASNREELARRAFEAIWMTAASAKTGWGGATPPQRVFWYKAAENIGAYILTGEYPPTGAHTTAESIRATYGEKT